MTAPWTNPAPLTDIKYGEINLLHRSAWSDVNKPLRVEFKPWYDTPPSVSGRERVEVFLDDKKNIIETREWELPMDESDYYIEIGANKLPEGEHKLGFVMTNFENVSDTSDLYTITIDKTEPLLATNSTLIFPPEVSPPYSITAAYLENPLNNDQVLATLPAYTDKKVGDVITWYWGSSDSDVEEVGTLTLEIDHINGALPQLTFTGDMIRDSSDGKRFAYYQIQDRAGNPSLASDPIELFVQASPIPRDFPHPTVLQASGNGSTSSLDPFNADEGITVDIPASVVLYEGEKIRVSWGVEGKAGYFLGEFSSMPEDRKLSVTSDYMPQHMGKSIVVTYQVKPVVGDVITSGVLTVNMTMIPRESMQYGYCEFPQVSMSNFPAAGLKVTLLMRWFLIQPGQWVKIYGRGVPAAPGVADITLPILNDFEVTQKWIDEGSITDLIVKADLSPFKIPSELTVITSFSFDGKETWMTEEGSPRSKLQILT